MKQFMSIWSKWVIRYFQIACQLGGYRIDHYLHLKIVLDTDIGMKLKSHGSIQIRETNENAIERERKKMGKKEEKKVVEWIVKSKTFAILSRIYQHQSWKWKLFHRTEWNVST